jgi:hypothetical protein
MTKLAEYRAVARIARKNPTLRVEAEALPIRKDGKLPSIVIRFTLDTTKKK